MRAAVVAACLVAAAVAAVVAFARAPATPDAASLAAGRPALPHTWVDDFGPGRTRTIGWRADSDVSTGPGDDCRHGSGAFRAWTNGGGYLDSPSLTESVCVYRFETLARLVYRWQSLYRVGGDDWPNFDPSLARERLPDPHPRASLGRLHADRWELGCGVGHADGLCSVWTFRARYGRVDVVLEFQADAGGIRFPAMRRLVRSVDGELSARLRSR